MSAEPSDDAPGDTMKFVHAQVVCVSSTSRTSKFLGYIAFIITETSVCKLESAAEGTLQCKVCGPISNEKCKVCGPIQAKVMNHTLVLACAMKR